MVEDKLGDLLGVGGNICLSRESSGILGRRCGGNSSVSSSSECGNHGLSKPSKCDRVSRVDVHSRAHSHFLVRSKHVGCHRQGGNKIKGASFSLLASTGGGLLRPHGVHRGAFRYKDRA